MLDSKTVEVNDLITWLNCPVPGFESGKVTAVSKCGQYIRYGFIRHPVALSQCALCTDENVQLFWSRYRDL